MTYNIHSMCVYIYVCMHIHTYIYININYILQTYCNTCVYTYIHTYI